MKLQSCPTMLSVVGTKYKYRDSNNTFWSSTSTLTFPYTKYSSTSSTDKYVLKYKYQVQVLYLTPTLVPAQHKQNYHSIHSHSTHSFTC